MIASENLFLAPSKASKATEIAPLPLGPVGGYERSEGLYGRLVWTVGRGGAETLSLVSATRFVFSERPLQRAGAGAFSCIIIQQYYMLYSDSSLG